MAIVLGSTIWAGAAIAHEFWLQVDQQDLGRGDTIEIRALVGQNLTGSEQIYSERAIRGFRYVYDGQAADVETRQGDRPAGRISRVRGGLYVVALMTNANYLTYNEIEKFNTFATTHGNDFAIEEHTKRGLPSEGIKESYFRFAKALVKVGDGDGSDLATGLPYELVALTNPYTDRGTVRMQLLFGGKPVPGHQVDVFHRPVAEADATKTELETDANGEIVFETSPGLYMISAVRLEEPSQRLKDESQVVWTSLWASTTFRLE